jgi:benzoyl-CoA reductase/2-hydroxyglutaryl-CoA dehydratase subunit BcrC/BadD/HgdB
VKRILDCVIQETSAGFAGAVIMNSCDAMRRLADAWRHVRPSDRIFLVDMPVAQDDRAEEFFREKLLGLSRALEEWGGEAVTGEDLLRSVERYNRLAGLLEALGARIRKGTIRMSAAELQVVYNRASTEPPGDAIRRVEEEMARPEEDVGEDRGVPVLLFGNVLPDPEAFSLFESCGARIIVEDLCTGSRLFQPLQMDAAGDPWIQLSRAILSRKPCARALDTGRSGGLAADILETAKACGARGVIGHTVKFCDSYLARIPGVREALRDAALPLLLLEGDCSMRSMGQHRTRIEAFVEMLR